MHLYSTLKVRLEGSALGYKALKCRGTAIICIHCYFALEVCLEGGGVATPSPQVRRDRHCLIPVLALEVRLLGSGFRAECIYIHWLCYCILQFWLPKLPCAASTLPWELVERPPTHAAAFVSATLAGNQSLRSVEVQW